jgi:trehalose 6-phosphate synthase/phosphatase
LLELLRRLASDPRSEVVIVSGRDLATLDRWFGALPVGLVAEHGASLRRAGDRWASLSVVGTSWRESVVAIMQVFADRLPGSFIEQKEVSVAWHYRGADDELGPARARELIEALRDVKSVTGVSVLAGNKVIEARPVGTTKGSAARRLLDLVRPDFVLAAGDDETDEDLFAALPDSALGIRVGPGDSRARYNIEGPAQLRSWLSELASRGPDQS